MFYCGFCGRYPSAEYSRKSVDHGIDVYKSVIKDAPKEGKWQDRFRISGGLEPLTNPRIGELVEYGAAYEYKMGIYTNGYMLTPRYLEKQQGLQALDYLRISMYGFDDETYERTTLKKGWSTVRDNLINFVNTTDIKIGLNWVILPGRTDDYTRFMHMVKELQDKLRRPIDFITVREDFSQNLVVISDKERDQLTNTFSSIEIMKNTYFPETKLDYGYQLHPMAERYTNGPLHMAKSNQLDPKGLPQATVQIDTMGNIFAYHGSAFLDRPGYQKFIIGNAAQGLEEEIKRHLESDASISYIPTDTGMLDSYDHAISLAVWRARKEPNHPIWSTLA